MAIGSDGVQLLGGHGYVKEHPVERWYRDLRAAGVMEGALLVCMPINLENPKKFERPGQPRPTRWRPRSSGRNSRKYDHAEHSYPKELDMLAAVIDGMNECGALGGAGAGGVGGGNGGNVARAKADRTATATAATWPACSA